MITLLKNSLPTLTEAVTCEWVNGFQDHGPMKTIFNYGPPIWTYIEIHGDSLYGRYIKIDWIFNEKLVYSDEGLLWEQIADFWFFRWFYISLLHGTGTGRIDIYLDDIYFGSTNNFLVLPATCDYWNAQAECIRKGCYWYNNTCNPNPP